MTSAVEWQAVSLAGSFILGAALATIATIRVMRAVAAMFGVPLRRSRRAPDDDEPTTP